MVKKRMKYLLHLRSVYDLSKNSDVSLIFSKIFVHCVCMCELMCMLLCVGICMCELMCEILYVCRCMNAPMLM